MIEFVQRPRLNNVTLVAATSVALRQTIEAIRASAREVEFADILLLTDREPAGLEPFIRWRPIDRLASRHDYSRFMLRQLVEHINTTHVLCVQWDGFVINGSSWLEEFLEYDYIGAPWPHFTDGHNVGNGGFSLRSRRLLEACASLPLAGECPEDVVISRLYRRQLEAHGLRFATQDLAKRFSYERMKPNGSEFGFHGAFNLVRHCSISNSTRMLRSLEAGLLARSERWEILAWALSRGQLGLAMNMLRRLI